MVLLELEPRSVYVMRGPIRWQWQHSMLPTRELRYSITFRTRAGAESAATVPYGHKSASASSYTKFRLALISGSAAPEQHANRVGKTKQQLQLQTA